MAGTILGMRGFDMGNAQLNSVDRSSDTSIVASTTEKHTGAYSLRIGGGIINNYARWRLTGNPTTPSISVWEYLRSCFNATGTGTANNNIRFRITDGTFVDLRWNGATHTYDAYVNNVLFKAGTVEVSVNTWFHVQFYATIAEAVDGGNVTVLINGHTSINENGDTKPGAATGVDYVYIYGGTTLNGYDYIDDLVLGYGGLLGSLRVRERIPDVDVTSDWTPSAGGDNYAVVDEVPTSDVDYNETSTTGHVDQFELTEIDFATLEEVPVALMPWVRAQMNEGTGYSIKVGLDSNGTAVNTQSALSTAWEYYFHTAVEDPDGGGQPWDTASANAADVTYESVID